MFVTRVLGVRCVLTAEQMKEFFTELVCALYLITLGLLGTIMPQALFQVVSKL